MLSVILAVTIVEPRGEAGGLVSSFVVVDPPEIENAMS
jgi:hypothetical protein